jgi:hypothetical protein
MEIRGFLRQPGGTARIDAGKTHGALKAKGMEPGAL